MIETSTIVASLIPAVALSQSATLLARAREIDLSLDQQCFLVAVLQVCFSGSVPAWASIVISVFVLSALQSARLIFNRVACANTMITSIASSLIYFGLAYLGMRYFHLGYAPQYALAGVTLEVLAGVAVISICLLLAADKFVGPMFRSKIGVLPLGGTPNIFASAFWCVLPASLLTCLASAVLAVHAGSVTESFSQNFGILGATAALVSYARAPRAARFGAIIAIFYVAGLAIAHLAQSSLAQSFLVPILSLASMGALALILSRP